MPISAQQLITNAMKLGILDAGESPTATESNDILPILNRLIDSWNIQDSMATAASIVSQVLVANTQSYALATRYVKIVSASINTGAGTFPVEVIDAVRWNTLPDRDISANWVRYLFYDRGFPTGNINLAPKPLGTGPMLMNVWLAQSTFATLGTSNTLNPGYEEALTTGLAIEIAPMFYKKVSDELLLSYRQAMDEIKRLNAQLWAVAVTQPQAAPAPAAAA